MLIDAFPYCQSIAFLLAFAFLEHLAGKYRKLFQTKTYFHLFLCRGNSDNLLNAL